ncbi:MAG: adenylate/guanylate cyclase domain-containing protein [Spirochaetales bacterium]|nr:adenylate/guanylate cyclase domain-containing protein [Spirochaetales bacterium]
MRSGAADFQRFSWPFRNFLSRAWLLLVVFFVYCGQEENCPAPRAGVLDLRSHETCLNRLDLSGEWLVGTGLNPEGWLAHKVPAAWTDPLPPQGVATYRLRILLPQNLAKTIYGLQLHYITSAYELRVNGIPAGGKGQPAAEPEYYRPEAASQLLPFAIPGPDVLLEITVANFTHAKGGIRTRIFFGRFSELRKYYDRAMMLDGFLAGGLILIGLYHFGLYYSRREMLSTIYFGIFALSVAVYSLCTGQHLIRVLLPMTGNVSQLRIEYLSIALGIVTFFAYHKGVFPRQNWKVALYAIFGFEIIYMLLVILTPSLFFTQLVGLQQGMLIVSVGYGLISVIVAVFQREPGARMVLAGFLVFGFTLIHDILNNRNIILSTPLSAYGFLAFLLAQAYLIVRIFSHAFDAISELTEQAIATSRAYGRFVPREFLKHLNKKDIKEIKLGDQIQEEMTVLFADIVNFTAMSEKMTPSQNFNFLNSYLGRMVPLIEKHGGFIDKFVGDGIMALFPRSGEDAVRAALAMFVELQRYNVRRRLQGFDSVAIGVGIHKGPLMLGTIGSESRMDSTVISDTVNIAARLEKLTRPWKTAILTTEAVVQDLSGDDFLIRLAGELAVRGKLQEVLIYEIGLSKELEEVEKWKATQGAMEAGALLYSQAQWTAARERFETVLAINPDDGVARWYVDRLEESRIPTVV